MDVVPDLLSYSNVTSSVNRASSAAIQGDDALLDAYSMMTNSHVVHGASGIHLTMEERSQQRS
jgi:hypothetical protein